MPNTRLPAVAGTFYASDAAALRRQIDWCFEHGSGPGRQQSCESSNARPFAVIAPHAGYRFSGPTAAHAYAKLMQRRRPEVVVVIGPNHRLVGAPVAVSGCDSWQTPLGPMAVDFAMSSAIIANWPGVILDDFAHRYEHSVEVQLPFIQYSMGMEIPVVPIVSHAQDFATSRALGLALADAARGRNVVIVATSDLTHYEHHVEALRQDRYALDAIEALDATGFANAVIEYGLSVCGPGPIVTAMIAATELGATRASLLHHGTSGELSGDFDRVVAYAAISLE